MSSVRSRITDRRRSGLTLVEVVGGLALTATLLVTLLSAHSAHLRQLQRAQGKLVAVDLLDDLLRQWSQGAGRIPRDQSGTIAAAPEFQWRTAVREQTTGTVTLTVVRVEIHSAAPDLRHEAPPLAVVEVVVDAK